LRKGQRGASLPANVPGRPHCEPRSRQGTIVGDLRSKRPIARAMGPKETAAPKEATAVLLQPCPPFDFAHTLRFILSPPALLNGRVFAPLVDHIQDGEYRRVARINGQPVLYGVSEDRRQSRKMLRVRILAGPGRKSVLPAVYSLVARQFATSLDLHPFYRLAKKDLVLSKLAASFQGLRIPQSPSVYECVVSAILEQQVNLTFAHQVKKALIETYGEAINFEGRRYNAFPEPQALAGVTPSELRKLQISGPKARYIIGVSRAVAEGRLDLEGLRSVPEQMIRSKLMEQKGVGPWTAEYVGLRALGNLDSLPSSDVGLQKAIQYFYRLRKQPAASRVEKIARKWAGWRSYATFYLWLTYWEPASWKKNLLEGIYSDTRIRDH